MRADVRGNVFLRSRKKRLVKKWFKKTGWLRLVFIGKRDGVWWYKAVLPFEVPVKERGVDNAEI